MTQPRLLFVSPRFLFPVDSGGKIRTTQVLRGMRGGRFRITLLSPLPDDSERYQEDLAGVCDDFAGWPESKRGGLFPLTRMRHLMSPLPVPVATDRSDEGRRMVEEALAIRPDVVVFDFPHAAVLAPDTLSIPSVMFTHNVEAEIFKRHTEVAETPWKRWLWRNQYRKMRDFERDVLHRFDRSVAVSERDRDAFASEYSARSVSVIPTGVDLEYFAFHPGSEGRGVVFTGSMDWLANVDGIEFLLDEIWPEVKAAQPDASMTVVGRDPAPALVEKAMKAGSACSFTGFVDDVRPYVAKSSVYVIPLRVGGGTRLKVFEAMAMGCPVVSTSIGVEGLPLEDGVHYLCADDPAEFARCIVRLLDDANLRTKLATQARRYVEENFSFHRVAREFEAICDQAIDDFETRREAA